MIWEELREGKRKTENNKKEENAICRAAVCYRDVHICM